MRNSGHVAGSVVAQRPSRVFFLALSSATVSEYNTCGAREQDADEDHDPDST